MKHLSPILLLISSVISILSFAQDSIVISTKNLNNKFVEGQKVFITRINYFEYQKSDYLIDSSYVNAGNISIRNGQNKQALYFVSNEKQTPLTYLPLIQYPEVYTYMFCSNFYTIQNYLLLEKKFNKLENDYFKEFYLRFSRNSFDRKLYKGSEYKLMQPGQALEKVEKQKKKFEHQLTKNKDNFSNAFNDYIYTEIELGSLNQYLNWYEETQMNKITIEFDENLESSEHKRIYDFVISKRWNSNSIQYFRMIERIINYNESKARKTFNTYFENIDEKLLKTNEIIKTTASNII